MARGDPRRGGGRGGRARSGRPDELPADRHPERDLPRPDPHRRADRRDGLAAVAHLARAARWRRMTALEPATPALASPPAADGPIARRQADLERLAAGPWDLVIVGGGIVGAGALLDAASRGLKVALVEQDDIAAGTSSRSSRLIHGGLRYLRQLDVRLVREALHERARLLRLAPHLIRLEEFLFPLYGPPVATRAFYSTGMTMYDVLGSALSGGRHRGLSKAETLEYAPNLVPDGLRGALLYHDAMEDDARYALAVVRTAIARGDGAAVAATRVRATGPRHDGGRVAGAGVTDLV